MVHRLGDFLRRGSARAHFLRAFSQGLDAASVELERAPGIRAIRSFDESRLLSQIGVLMAPGSTTETERPKGASSRRKASLNASSANFDML